MGFRSTRNKKSELPRYQAEDDKFKPRNRDKIALLSASWKHQPKRQLLKELALLLFSILGIFQMLNSESTTRSWFRGQYSPQTSPDGTLVYYDLDQYQGSSNGWDHQERMLMCIPLRNAEDVLPMMFSHLRNLTYPHELIDIAFMVSDTTDNTLRELNRLSTEIQLVGSDEDEQTKKLRYNSIEVYEKDFGQLVGQGFDDRHGVAVQGMRRKVMGRARNWLTAAALKPYHSWVYWRDADIETAPPTILEDLMSKDQDVIVPNVWRPLPEWLGGEQPYDLNSWQESDAAIELAKTLDEDDVIVEGYAEYPTWRPHLAYFRSPNGDLNEMIPLDGIGGVSILARAKVFRQGANFPGFAFLNHAETEGFGKMARRMGYSVSGLVHYTVWHQYEPSDDDLKKMKEMEAEAEAKAAAAAAKGNGKIMDIVSVAPEY